jgi:3',5'-cyclic AMP phosphodiesterase CpdA
MPARIAHLSDVHFGANDPKIVAATEAWLEEHQPDLVVISGDFTQRARVAQFKEASAWLNRLRAAGHAILAVPGNHDVPLYDVVTRFTAPLQRYRRYISNDLAPWFENEQVAVLGINTARSLTIKDGRINRAQMALIEQRFAAVSPEKTRILVTHHPLFAMPIGEGTELTEAVGRHERAITAVCRAGVHVALAGHFHRTYAEAARKMVERAGGALVIQAGTATSTRLRNDELQSFNWIHAHRNNDIELQVIAWDGAAFNRGNHVRFDYDGNEWQSRTIIHEHEAG